MWIKDNSLRHLQDVKNNLIVDFYYFLKEEAMDYINSSQPDIELSIIEEKFNELLKDVEDLEKFKSKIKELHDESE